jgi:thiol-disulfide isomerase/thioredoxin
MIKYLLLCFVLAAPLAAQTPAPIEATPADRDYAAFEALLKESPPGSPKDLGGAGKFLTWIDGHLQKVTAVGLAFYAAYPTDARRWYAVLALSNQPPYFARGFGPDVEDKWVAAAIIDAAAKTAWQQNVEKLNQALLASADAPASAREAIEFSMFSKDFRATSAAKAKGEPFDYSGFRARFDAHVAKYAALDVVADRASDYLGALERNLPGASAEVCRHLLAAPNAALREQAAAQVKVFEIMSRPLVMAFTAIDGRTVDLKSLRGKVVLIDFWATWCGPCIAELPNVKKVYATYHDKGFEVVGIALEDGKLLPKDTPEQTAEKMAKAKKVLTDFTAKENMPWPQYFDGQYWKTDVAAKYGIGSIPAMFLLDQEGKVVSTNARGELLEKEVKRLLKL